MDNVDGISLSRRSALALLVGALAILVVAGGWLGKSGGAKSPGTAAAIAPVAAAAPARIVVDVVGAVRDPGLYRLPDGARVADAILRAGGLTRGADRRSVNLAAPLADGLQVVVARAVPAGGGSDVAVGGKVSLATATLDDLDALPGIGPVTAEKIISYRSSHGAFRSVEDLDDIPGIGPARIEQLRDLVTP